MLGWADSRTGVRGARLFPAKRRVAWMQQLLAVRKTAERPASCLSYPSGKRVGLQEEGKCYRDRPLCSVVISVPTATGRSVLQMKKLKPRKVK